jgi:TM2 domain-containing membrane protein YozV
MMILSELLNIENAMNLDYRILSCLVVLLTLSVLFIVLGIKRFFRGKVVSAGIQSLSGVSLLLAGLLFLSIATNLYSYDRLTYEQDIAKLTFSQLDEQEFRVEITYANQDKTDGFLINGDEWQMDARVIK